MIITVANQKGGVGKTDVSVNLAASLSALGKKVLVIDLDPQANATSYMLKERPDVTSSSLLKGGVELSKAVVATGLPNLFAVAAAPDLSATQAEIAGMQGAHFNLRDKLKEHDYDYVLIDTPPSLGMLTISALAASDAVLVPIQVQYFALDGAKNLVKTVESLKKEINPGIDVMGFVLTMHDKRNKLSNKIEGTIRKSFGEAVFENTIPVNVDLSLAPNAHKPVLKFKKKSIGAHAYSRLAKEFIRRLGG